jgi:hypothetical protein
MLVPEAAMDKYHLLPAWECHVGRARQVTQVKAEAVSEGVRKSTDDKLGFGVPAPDPRHQGGSLCCREHVHFATRARFACGAKDYAPGFNECEA